MSARKLTTAEVLFFEHNREMARRSVSMDADAVQCLDRGVALWERAAVHHGRTNADVVALLDECRRRTGEVG